MLFEKKYISKKDDFIVKVMFGVPFACFLGFMIYSFLNRGDIMETKKQNDLNNAFNGRVKSLYRDRNNHNVKVAILSDGFKYAIPYPWEELFNVGDHFQRRKTP